MATQQESAGRTVVVTDMAGFTRKTRRYGIVHVGSLIMKMRSLMLLAMRRHGGVATSLADNCFGEFADPASAVAAVFACRRAVDTYNRDQPESNRLEISGIGIATGDTLASNVSSGPVADLAFVLGEDIASDGQLLITEPALQALRDTGCSDGLTFEQRLWAELEQRPPSATGDGYSLVGGTPASLPGPSRDQSVLEYETPEEQHLADLCERRLTPGSDTEAIDAEIRESYMSNATVLLFALRDEDTADQELRVRIIELMQRVLTENGGTVQRKEDVLVFFDHPTTALAAAVACRDALGREGLSLRGIGIDHGEMLVIKGTVISWGDPINTAAKLAEELATEGRILLSRQAHRDVQHQFGLLMRCHYEDGRGARSGVTLDYQDVSVTNSQGEIDTERT